jgi:hypothetical protein
MIEAEEAGHGKIEIALHFLNSESGRRADGRSQAGGQTAGIRPGEPFLALLIGLL